MSSQVDAASWGRQSKAVMVWHKSCWPRTPQRRPVHSFHTPGVWHHANTTNAFSTLLLQFTRKREKASGQKPASQGWNISLNLQKANPKGNSYLLLRSAPLSWANPLQTRSWQQARSRRGVTPEERSEQSRISAPEIPLALL